MSRFARRLEVWAPAARSVRAVVEGRAELAMPRTVTAGGRPRRNSPPPPTTASASTMASRCPIRARAGSRTAFTARRVCSTPQRLPGTTPAGSHRRWTRGVIYEAACRHVQRRGHVRRRDRPPRPPRLAGRDARRADAGRRVSGRSRLGLRRRRPVRAASRVRRARRAWRGSSTPATPAAWRSSSTSSTTTSARPATTWRASGPTSPIATQRPGATRSTSTARAATRCAASSSTTP